MSERRWKGIHRAALEIAYDNGGINRMRSERDHRRDLKAYLDGTKIATVAELKAINEWLSELTNDEMITVCSGEETEMLGFMSLRNAPPKTHELLNDIFEEVG